MGSFITGTEIEVIQDEGWEPWETITIRKYNQAQSDTMDKELIEMAGAIGEVPRIVQQSARIPVLVAGVEGWTLRNLSDSKLAALYEKQAKSLKKDVSSLSDDEKTKAVEKVPVEPVTRESLGQLNPLYAAFATVAIRLFNRERTEKEEQEFLRCTRPRHSDQGETPAGDNAD